MTAANPTASRSRDGATAAEPKRGRDAMKPSITIIEPATTLLTSRSGMTTVSAAPSAEVTAVMTTRGTTKRPPTSPARAKRTVAEAAIQVTANMLVATAMRGSMPNAMSAGTCTSEPPPVTTLTTETAK